MNRKLAMAVAMTLLPIGAQAQMVPALDKTALVEAFPADSGEAVKLDAREKEALSLAKEWINNPEKPVRSSDGSVKYVYGATLPTLICSVGRVCMIRLEEGEELVDDIMAADPVRWDIKTMDVGHEGRLTTMISVKPKYPALITNMVITTNRRSYMILLKSTNKDWVPEMSFIYPEDAKKAMASYRNKRRQAAYSSTLSTGQNAAALDFEYRMSGDTPWKPIRVYNDGAQTYIQFPSANFNDGAPALVEISNGGGMFSEETTEIYNYRVVGDRYVVDGKPKRMGLLSGAGKGEKRVLIDYVGGKTQ